MGRHDELTTPLDTCLEGNHLARQHLIPCLLTLGIAIVRIGLGVAMPGEVLDTARHTGILQSLQVAGHHRHLHDLHRLLLRHAHFIDLLEGVDVEAVLPQIRADGVAAVVGILWVTRLADGIHRYKGLHVKVRVSADAGHTTTLFVDTEQWRPIQGTYLWNECRQLCFILNVVRIENDTTHRVFLVHAPHRLVHCL